MPMSAPVDGFRLAQRARPRGGAGHRSGGARRLRRGVPYCAVRRASPADLVRGLVVSPPVPGVGQRVLSPQAQREYWYQPFHQLDLAERLIDGRRDAVHAYLAHFWSHWSGPEYTVGEHYSDIEVRPVTGIGHFLPLEAPDAFAAAITERAAAHPG